MAFARRDPAPLLIAHVMTPPLPVMGDGSMTPATWDALVTGYRKDTFALARHAGFLIAAGSVLFLTAGLYFSRARMRDP